MVGIVPCHIIIYIDVDRVRCHIIIYWCGPCTMSYNRILMSYNRILMWSVSGVIQSYTDVDRVRCHIIVYWCGPYPMSYNRMYTDVVPVRCHIIVYWCGPCAMSHNYVYFLYVYFCELLFLNNISNAEAWPLGYKANKKYVLSQSLRSSFLSKTPRSRKIYSTQRSTRKFH